jgi:ribonucleoside-triphosphate reductase (formate)
MKTKPVIYNGKVMQDTYGDMTKEMEMFNIAFAEGMKQGDAKGRVFTFPIPTYNITKDFDWDSPVHRQSLKSPPNMVYPTLATLSTAT